MEEHWTAAAVGYEERAGCEGETIPPDLVPYIWLLVVTEGNYLPLKGDWTRIQICTN